MASPLSIPSLLLAMVILVAWGVAAVVLSGPGRVPIEEANREHVTLEDLARDVGQPPNSTLSLVYQRTDAEYRMLSTKWNTSTAPDEVAAYFRHRFERAPPTGACPTPYAEKVHLSFDSPAYRIDACTDLFVAKILIRRSATGSTVTLDYFSTNSK